MRLPLLLLLTLLPALTVAPLAFAGSLLVVSQGTGQVLEYDDGDGSFLGVHVDPVTEGFALPGGIALRPSDGSLYVSSTGTDELWIYDAVTGVASPPPAATGLLAPGWLAFDASGSTLYLIADVPAGEDTASALLELPLPGGTPTTVALDVAAGFSAFALQGAAAYVSDSLNGTVERIPLTGGSRTTVISGLLAPGGILFLSSTELLVADTASDQVLEFHETAGTWTLHREVLPASAGVDGPFGLALAPDGRLTVTGSFSNDAVAVDLGTLAVMPLVAPGAGGLSAAGQIAWSGATLLIASRTSNAVNYYDANGNPTGVRAQGLSAPADAGSALTSSGGLLVASGSANEVGEYDDTGSVIGTLSNACPLSFTNPFDVAVDAAGAVYVSCSATGGVRRFDASGISQSFVLAGSGGLGAPRGLAFGPGGNLFVASLTGEVLEYDGANGSFVGTFIDTTGNGGGSVDPYGLAFEGGSLYVTSFFPSEVREFDASTGAFVQTFVASGSGGLARPSQLAFGPGGDLYVTSQGDDSIKRYDGANGSFVGTFVASGSGGLDQPFDLAFRFSAQPAPALAAAGRIALALLIATLGARALTRRARASQAGARR